MARYDDGHAPARRGAPRAQWLRRAFVPESKARLVNPEKLPVEDSLEVMEFVGLEVDSPCEPLGKPSPP